MKDAPYRFGVFLIAALCAAGWVMAKSPADIITSRQSQLKDMGGDFKAMNDELKKAKPDVAALQMSADEVSDVSTQIGKWFPAGTGPEAGIKTRAKPEIWSDSAGFSSAVNAFSTAAPQLQKAVQSGDLDAIKLNIKNVGQQCKGCHDKYREKEEQ